jgi:hypothetical protein
MSFQLCRSPGQQSYTKDARVHHPLHHPPPLAPFSSIPLVVAAPFIDSFSI